MLQRFLNLFKSNKVTTYNANEYLRHRAEQVRLTTTTFDMSKPELCSTIYASVSIIANTISKLPIHVYKQTEKGKVPFYDHPWYATLRYNPDARLSTSKWLNHAITTMYLTGNAFYYRQDYDVYLNTGNKELKPLGAIKNVVAYEGEIYYKFEDVEGWIASKDLVHFYLISKDGGITGLNPIASIRSELSIQHGAEQTVSTFYQNQTFSVLYIEADLEGVGTADKKKLQEYFEQVQNEFSGSQNSGKILRVPPMYKLRSLPMADLRFLENSKYTISQIASVFQVPSSYLGVQESSSTYGKAEQEQIRFKNTCLGNVCSIFRAELEAKILTVEERNAGVSIDFDFSNLYDTDLESKANFYKTLSTVGAVSPNQIAMAFGLPKIDSPNGDLHFLQRQYTPLEFIKENQIEAEPVADDKLVE